MFSLMKKTIVVLSIIAVFIIVFIAAKNIIVRKLLETGVERQLGLEVRIDDLDVSPLGTHLRIEGLTIYNPAGFETKEMAYIPLFFVVCDPIEYIKDKNLHFYLLDLNVERVNIIKNKEGLINIKEIKPIKEILQQTGKAGGVRQRKKLSFKLDILRMGLGDIYYTDYYNVTKPRTKKYTVGIKEAMFSNIDSPRDIIELVIVKILTNTEVGKLIDMSIAPIASDISDVVVLAGKTIKASIKGLYDGIATPFKILFGER